MVWILGILVAAIVATLVFAAVRRPEKSRAAELRKRYSIEPGDAARIPLAADKPPAPPPTPIAEIPFVGHGHSGSTGTPIFERERTTARTVSSNWLGDRAREDEPLPAPGPAIGGRIVRTADGETVITTPPFALREQMVSSRLGRFVNGLNKRLPVWMIACPRVRLETLVTPTPPDGRDADDWGQWRRRVRLRAVDVVVCDRRNWKPVLAIMLKPATRFGRSDGTNGTVTALSIGGGRDQLIDEVLTHVGLTLVHASGKLTDDWRLIAPYVEQAILKSASEEDLLAATEEARDRPDPDAAVKLLKLDGEKGWLLE